MQITLPPLPYYYEALEPYISRCTLSIHHNKHHKAYVEKTKALAKVVRLDDQPLESIIRLTARNELHRALFNNAAQAWNHAFYWRSLQPNGGGAPGGEIAARIEADLGGENPRIQWEAVSIKGRKAHSYSLPEELVAPMRRFTEKYRPMLMGADAEAQDWFWGPRRGGSGENRELTPAAINRIIARRSLELVKKRVTGHSRRHGVATMFTEEAPGNVRLVTPLLQQADPRSRELYNRRAKKVTATKLAAECWAVLRKQFNRGPHLRG